MKTLGGVIKSQNITILVTLTVIFALIFLCGSQALSKRPPWRPNYEVKFQGELIGIGPVKLHRESVSSGAGDTFLLYFSIEGFEGERLGWLNFGIPKRSDRSNFYYSWTSEEDGFDYSLSGWGTVEYDKKAMRFTFISDMQGGDWHITQWSPLPTRVWEGVLDFTIIGIPLSE